MPTITKIILPCFFLLFVTNLHAFVLGTTPKVEEQEKKEIITVEQFIAMTPASMETTTGKKMGWGKKQLLKLAQKRLKKRLAKGDVQLNDAAFEGNEPRLYSLTSLIFSIAAVVFILLGLIALLTSIGTSNLSAGLILIIISLILAIVGLALGITGISQEGESVMAIIGIVVSSLVLLPFVLGFIINRLQ